MANNDQYLEGLIARKNALEDELDGIVEAILVYMRTNYSTEAKTASVKRKRIQPERFIQGRQKRFAQHLCSVLVFENRPLSKNELFIAAVRHGVTITSRNPSRYVETALYRNPDLFYHVPHRGYWVRGVPEP